MEQLKHTESNYQHYFLGFIVVFHFSAIQENLYMIASF